MKLLMYLIICLFIISCKQHHESQIEKNSNDEVGRQINLSGIDYSIIEYEVGFSFFFEEILIPTTLNENEIKEVFHLATDDMNTDEQKWKKYLDSIMVLKKIKIESHIKMELKNYQYQLIAGLNGKKEKIVLVNAFCDSMGVNWRKDIVFVNDGGRCFFNLKINLYKHKVFDFIVNGVA